MPNSKNDEEPSEIDINEWAKGAHKDIDDFVAFWSNSRQQCIKEQDMSKDAAEEIYPNTLTEGEWDEQFMGYAF